MPSLNPFYRVIETNKNTQSSDQRTTFLEKLSDTFFVLAGNRHAFLDGNPPTK